MYMRIISLIPLLLFVQVSFAQTKFSEKVGGHVFRMNIPDYMAKTFDLNDNAALQYQNTQKEAYTIVIEDSKEQLEKLGMKYVSAKDFLEDFAKDFHADKVERVLSTITEFDLTPMKFAQAELTWKQDDIKFFMIITTVESSTYFYKILCWTIFDNKDTLKKDFLTIAKSLKD
jgi:hypothetical protein